MENLKIVKQLKNEKKNEYKNLLDFMVANEWSKKEYEIFLMGYDLALDRVISLL